MKIIKVFIGKIDLPNTIELKIEEWLNNKNAQPINTSTAIEGRLIVITVVAEVQFTESY
jgi:hypothetical protein